MARTLYGPKEEYLGDGTLDTYTFDFKIENLNGLLVIEIDDTGVELQRVYGSDSSFLDSVTFDPINGGGTVVLQAVLPANYRLLFLLAFYEPTQPYEFKGKGAFLMKQLEAALDWFVGSLQSVAYRAHRSVKLSDHDDPEEFDPTLPPGMATALSLIPNTNSTGTGWDDVANWTPVADLAAAVAAAAAAAVSETNAAASAAAAAASANAAAVSAAAALVSENNAAIAETNAETAETNAELAETNAEAAQVAAEAAQAAAAVSAAAALVSETNAATAETNAETAETNAELAETNAEAAQVAAEAAQAAAEVAQAAAEAAASTPIIHGTYNAPVSVSAGVSIPFGESAYNVKIYIVGNGGPVDMAVNPQIAAGIAEGQKIRLIGTDDTNTVLLEDGNGLNIRNAWVAEAGSVLDLDWDAANSVWMETGRN